MARNAGSTGKAVLDPVTLEILWDGSLPFRRNKLRWFCGRHFQASFASRTTLRAYF